MTRFRFSLERVLELRRTQLKVEEVRLGQTEAALAELDGTRAEIDRAALRAETEVRAGEIAGFDLAALAAYRHRARERSQEIAGKRAARERELEGLRTSAMEARRRVRLLERLRERRHAEWQAAAGKELEEMASESYLARWAREH
jgi:flagellar export protein FliJ